MRSGGLVHTDYVPKRRSGEMKEDGRASWPNYCKGELFKSVSHCNTCTGVHNIPPTSGAFIPAWRCWWGGVGVGKLHTL